MCHRTPIPIYSGSVLFRWLDKQLNACSTTVRRFKLNRLYRHTPRMRALSALGFIFGPCRTSLLSPLCTGKRTSSAPVSMFQKSHVGDENGELQASRIQSTMRRSPLTDRRVVATASEEACVSIVSVRGASRVGSVAANRVAIGISPSPTATKRRATLEKSLMCRISEKGNSRVRSAADGG